MKRKMIPLLVLATIIASPTAKAMSLDTIKNSCQAKPIIAEDLYKDEEFVKDIHKYLVEVYGEEYSTILKKNAESVSVARKIEENISKKVNGKITYPNYYSGMYIDENDNLVMQVAKKNIPNTKSNQYKVYNEIVNTYENIKIEEVKYSYEELENIHNIILEYFVNLKNDIVTGLYIDVPSNSVVVELTNNTEENIAKFKKDVVDSQIISYENAKDFEDMVNPGGNMYLGVFDGQQMHCSWGYRAKNSSGQIGMVTAAHCMDRSGYSYVEPYTVRKQQNSGTIDAAWIVASSLTNTLNQKPPFSDVTTLSTTVISSFYSGQKIAKLGTTTGYTVGTVTNPSYSGTFGTPFTDLVLASLPVNGGDSGGIVMEQNIPLGSNGFKTAGIVKAGLRGTTTMVFTKATNINSIFGISRY